MNTSYVQGKRIEVTSKLITKGLKREVKSIGKEHLGIKADTVGKKSIRTYISMYLYINKFYTPTIMLMGRWKIDCFMKYLQNHVNQFSKEVSSRMIGEEIGNLYKIPEFQ